MIQADEIDVRFGSTHAVCGASIHLGAGEAVGLLGRSGSGKSSLLFCLSGLLRPTSGRVSFRDTDYATLSDEALTRTRGENFGFVFQFAELVPELSLRENISLPADLLKWKRGDVRRRVADLADALELSDLLDRLPEELSGGQAQRGAVARALVHGPAVVFADEPTGSLDSTSAEAVVRLLLSQTRALGAALVLVTHDQELAARMDRRVELSDGRICEHVR